MTMPYRLLAMTQALLVAASSAVQASSAAFASPTASAVRPMAKGAAPTANRSSASAPSASASSTPAASSAAAPTAKAPSPAAPPASSAKAAATRRVPLPGADGKPVPYTIEIPATWQVHSSKDVPGVFLGPAEVSEPGDPRAIWVRDSPTPLVDPYAVVAKIKEKTATDFSWSAPVLEVRDLGGIRGVLVRMDSGSGQQARSTLVLKMPYRQASLDFMVSAPRAEFESRLSEYQRIILSVQPVSR
jgi:hypothetical protein